MKRSMDKIQFESRIEVGEVTKMIEKYFEAYPGEKNNKTVNRLYDLLDVMELEW